MENFSSGEVVVSIKNEINNNSNKINCINIYNLFVVVVSKEIFHKRAIILLKKRC